MKIKVKTISVVTLIIWIVLNCILVSNDGKVAKAADLTGDNQLVIYPEFPEQIVRDYSYSVTVTQGDKSAILPVYNHTMESTISRNADGADNFRRFSTFAFSGSPVRVDIKVNFDFESYSVMPSAKNFKHTYKDGVISVYLDKPDYFLIRLDNSDNTILSVFADSPENLDDIDFSDSNTIKIEGWHEPEDGTGILEITEPNTTLYIAPGAVLNARVRISGNNCRVLGRGAIVDPYEDIYNYDIRDGGNAGDGTKMISFEKCLGGIADGVHLLDARCFNVAISGSKSENITLRNLKILSSMMTTDGISIFGGKNHLAEHCFVYCGDNVMVFAAKDSVYRDIIAGTTCATLYPQGDPNNVALEDIHIFRSDDGVVNQDFAAGEGSALVTVNSLDSVDCTYMPHFFRGEDVGTALKQFAFTDISLGDTGVHKTTKIFQFLNRGGNHPYSDNWEIGLTNFALNGVVVVSADEFTNDDAGKSNTITVGQSGSFDPVTHGETVVSYKEKEKVYVGNWRVYFSKPVIVEGKVFYLPAEEIKYELRANKVAATVEKNGVNYISSDMLVSSGMAKTVEIKDDSLIITSVNDGKNLFVDDSGELSRFTERDVSKLHMYTTGTSEGWVYTVENTRMDINAGIQRLLNEDIKKYGEGRYTISFKAKAKEAGQIGIWLATKSRGTERSAQDVGTEWKDYSCEFEVDSGKLADTNIVFIIQSANKALSEFSVRDITLKKYELVEGSWVIPTPAIYDITTNNGYATVDGNTVSKAEKDTCVTITADAAPSGKHFKEWKVVSGGITLESATSATTTFTMPANAVEVTATYEDDALEEVTEYEVVVNNGTGDGSYEAGKIITITADVAPSGKHFKEWKVVSGGITLESATSATTTFTMPANAVEVTASYEDDVSEEPTNDTKKDDDKNIIDNNVKVIMDDYKVDVATAKEILKVAVENDVDADTLAMTQEAVEQINSDEDVKGSTYRKLQAKATKNEKTTMKISWKKQKNADGYMIYVKQKGKECKFKLNTTADAKKTSVIITKLEKKKNYTFFVVAYKKVAGQKVTITTSKNMHSVTKGSKYDSVKSIKINKIKLENGKVNKKKDKITLKYMKSAKISATQIKAGKKLKVVRKVEYESSNMKVATVNNKGTIKAVGVGKCTVYVYGQNGVCKTILVTVK